MTERQNDQATTVTLAHAPRVNNMHAAVEPWKNQKQYHGSMQDVKVNSRFMEHAGKQQIIATEL